MTAKCGRFLGMANATLTRAKVQARVGPGNSTIKNAKLFTWSPYPNRGLGPNTIEPRAVNDVLSPDPTKNKGSHS